jgi:hypothetical protein
MENVKSQEVVENGAVVGFDVAYRGVSHRLMVGESYEGSQPIKSRSDAEACLREWVDSEEARRQARA